MTPRQPHAGTQRFALIEEQVLVALLEVALHAGSPYDGPVQISTYSFHQKSILLARPEDPDRLLEDPEVLAWNQQDDYMPYWAYLWPGAFLLAEAVAREKWDEGTQALELGCGLGLAGLVALASGSGHVRFTDYDQTPLRFVARSAEVNGFAPKRFSTTRLDWREPPEERYPLILGADVLYEKPLVPLVVGVLKRMLTSDGFALIAGPYRVATEDLKPRLNAEGFRHEATPITSTPETGASVHGTLHRIWRGR